MAFENGIRSRGRGTGFMDAYPYEPLCAAYRMIKSFRLCRVSPFVILQFDTFLNLNDGCPGVNVELLSI